MGGVWSSFREMDCGDVDFSNEEPIPLSQNRASINVTFIWTPENSASRFEAYYF
jgi:hypothetical protein